MLNSKQEIKQWLDEMGIEGYKINTDLSIDVKKFHVKIKGNITELPVQFREVHSFVCRNVPLRTLKGCPIKVKYLYEVTGSKIQSLEFAPNYVGGEVWLGYNRNLRTLQNIHKHIQHIGDGIDVFKSPIKSHILGLFFIKGLSGGCAFDNDDLEKIINKHLTGDRDVHQCQEELIKAGFTEYAKL